MPVKACSVCGERKPLTDFYKYARSKDGHSYRCKECSKQIVKSAREKRKEYYKQCDAERAKRPHNAARRKAYSKTPKGRRIHKKSSRKWAENNPLKKKTHNDLNHEIRMGRIVRGVCEVCGEANVDAHHDDYSKPLEVRWLCKKHHREHHAKCTQEQNSET